MFKDQWTPAEPAWIVYNGKLTLGSVHSIFDRYHVYVIVPNQRKNILVHNHEAFASVQEYNDYQAIVAQMVQLDKNWLNDYQRCEMAYLEIIKTDKLIFQVKISDQWTIGEVVIPQQYAHHQDKIQTLLTDGLKLNNHILVEKEVFNEYWQNTQRVQPIDPHPQREVILESPDRLHVTRLGTSSPIYVAMPYKNGYAVVSADGKEHLPRDNDLRGAYLGAFTFWQMFQSQPRLDEATTFSAVRKVPAKITHVYVASENADHTISWKRQGTTDCETWSPEEFWMIFKKV